MRCKSLWEPEIGVSGLFPLGACEARREDCPAKSELAQLGAFSATPFCDAGDTRVGKAWIDLASVVNSARSVAVRSHIKVFMVVVLSWDSGGIKIASRGRRGCRDLAIELNIMKL
jgi:hypothetical protein